jgi:hypothetical protein
MGGGSVRHTREGWPNGSPGDSEAGGRDVKAAEYPVYALTTSELDERRRALEHAIREIPQCAGVPECLRDDLAEVIAEQGQRARIRQASRRNDDRDHYCVRQQTTAELERVKRELRANLGLVTADSPARVPIQNHLRAVDAELADRADGHHARGTLP